MKKLFALSICIGLLAGCGKDDAAEADPDAPARQTSQAQAEPAQPTQVAAQPASGPTPLQRGVQPVAPPQPVPPPPPQVFMPSVQDVEGVFLSALSNTYAAMPAATQPQAQARDQWYANERKKLAQVRIQSCSQSTAGTASVCRVQFGGSLADIKLIYTERGWQLVP